MNTSLIVRGTLILPDRIQTDGELVIQGGRLSAVRRASRRLLKNSQVMDVGVDFLSPGFIDLHVHGGDGSDFMDGTASAVQRAVACHLRHGTTTLFPTTTTGSLEQLEAMIDACAQVATAQSESPGASGARIAGIHLYGPYFAPNKVGCHAPEGRRDPQASEYRRLFQSGTIRIATCAAELPGATSFYRYAHRHKCLVTCGHSNASWKEMERAFQAGMRHVDHFWCAMSSVVSLRQRFGTPMQASMEQFVLAEREMSTEVIADGCHLSPELLRFALQMKGPNRLCLVTDASRALDQPTGRYRFGNDQEGPWFFHDGQVGRTLDGSSLASSTAGMDRMLRNMHRATGAPLPQLIRMASLTPAQRTGCDHEVGSLEEGKRADFVHLSRSLRVRQVAIQGQLTAVRAT